MVIKGNGAVNTMEAVKINTKEKERTKVTYHKSVFSSVLTGITREQLFLHLPFWFSWLDSF